MLLKFIALAWVLLLLGGCQDESNIYQPDNSSAKVLRSRLDTTLRGLIQQHGLSGDALQGRILPTIESPLAQLGMHLFFSKSLSGNRDVACASCHHPLLGGGDNLSLSIGVDAVDPNVLGHKRLLQGGLSLGVPRNAPTTFNIGLWQQFMFHDGRVAQLDTGITTPDVAYLQPDPLAGSNLVHAQARFPVTSNHEMRGKTFDVGGTAQSCRERLAERLGGYGAIPEERLPAEETDYWLDAFRKVYQQPQAQAAELITEQNIAAALAEYQRSQVFVNHAWKQYVQGELAAISEPAKRGALLFFRESEAGGYACASCHRGDFFTDELFRNVLMPPLGPGKGNMDTEVQQDYGRWLVTQNPDDKFRFRTPSLLNVAVTGPWGHNGAYTSLNAIVRHMLNPFQAALNYDSGQLKQPNIPTEQFAANLRDMLGSNTDMAGQAYQEEDVQYLVAFLHTLTDPCVTHVDCLQPWIPPVAGLPKSILQARF
ncbi:cytochrome c peroxidase [Thiothrix caldifontis]|uniref:Cytochrome c peroxidase n=1 Tax=Thiothrix caldifontis TaxID=525918 RepID=A0A1H4A5Q1_9GAMM|nr:cytochrome c peroxidase [Thiothrix caldifontis]SEA30784.1 cytochrome c peroxidase [Thiothrix caldifontis]